MPFKEASTGFNVQASIELTLKRERTLKTRLRDGHPEIVNVEGSSSRALA